MADGERRSSWLVRLVLKATDDGGRRSGIDLSGGYRPHVQVGDGEYLGVIVVSEEVAVLEPGEGAQVVLHAVYDVDYSALRPGVAFVMREGPHAVGVGEVLAHGRSRDDASHRAAPSRAANGR